jgi:crotonobetainyl-CoA:carnitine CoA-transferase CaiB-like acyl-CoA transferase
MPSRGSTTTPTAGPALPGIAPSNVYPSADGQWVVIGANQDTVFRRLAAALGHPEWAADGAPLSTHTGRGAQQVELDDAIACWTRERSVNDILQAMAAAGVPAGRIYTAADISVDPQYASREMVIEVPEPGLEGELCACRAWFPE